MTTYDCIICFGNSNTDGIAPVSAVGLTDWSRWLGIVFSPSSEPYSQSSSNGRWWRNRMPYREGDVRNTVAAGTGATAIEVDGAAFTAAQVDSWLWVKTDGGAGHGQHRRILSAVGNVATVAAWGTVPSVTGTIELLTGTHTTASATTTVITKTGVTDALASASVGKWLVMISGAAAGQARRITAVGAATATLDLALSVAPSAGDGFRILNGDDASEGIDEIAGDWSDFAAVYSDALSFSSGEEIPSWKSAPKTRPIGYNNESDRYLNYAPELAWQMQSASSKPVHVIHLGVSGSTIAPQFVGTFFKGGAFSWSYDVTDLSWHPGAVAGLFTVLKNTITAAAGSLADDGHKINVVGVFATLLENDTALAEWLVNVGDNLGLLRDTLRAWLATNGYTTRAKEQIPFLLTNLGTTFGASGTVANEQVEALVAVDPYMRFIDTSAYTLLDTSHFGTASMVLLGQDFYGGWREIIDAEIEAANQPAVFGPSEALWQAVKLRYDNGGLLTLTNIRNPAGTTIDDEVGEAAAQSVIDLFPVYAQEEYDTTNGKHVEVGVRGVIAMLWSRGGTSAQVAKIEWDEVFSDGGLIARVKNTSPRGRAEPITNSGVEQRPETRNGQPIQGWSDRKSLPRGILPRDSRSRGE